MPDGYSNIIRSYVFGPSGVWLRYAMLQNLSPSFPWIAPGWRAWGRKEGIKFCQLATLEERGEGGGTFSLLYLNLKVFDNTLSLSLSPSFVRPGGDCSSCLMAVKERERGREPEGGKNRRNASSRLREVSYAPSLRFRLSRSQISNRCHHFCAGSSSALDSIKDLVSQKSVQKQNFFINEGNY